jgi:hypothetical protein
MNEAGLPDKWRRMADRNVGYHCSGNMADAKVKSKSKKQNQRIPLKNMLGSFVILLTGIFSSMVAFVFELILRRHQYASVTAIDRTTPPISVVIDVSLKNIIAINNSFTTPKTVNTGNRKKDSARQVRKGTDKITQKNKITQSHLIRINQDLFNKKKSLNVIISALATKKEIKQKISKNT